MQLLDFLDAFLARRSSTFSDGMKNVMQYDTLDPIESLELYLRTVVINDYEGKTADAKFFVLNAKVLKVMQFVLYGRGCNGNWTTNQPAMLELDNRASRDARFYFVRDICRRGFDRGEPTHDMTIADPFASALRR